MHKHSLNENNFEAGVGGFGGAINTQPGYGTFASPEVSQNSSNFDHSDRNKSVNQFGNTRKDAPGTGSLNQDVNAVFSKKPTPTPDEVVAGIKYEMGQQIKKDKFEAKKTVMANLKKDPKFYSGLKMLNIDDKSMVDNMSEQKIKRIDPTKLNKALDMLRRVNPAGYSQLLMLPFGVVPAYAQEDPSSEWWSSDEAHARYRDVIDALKDVPKPGGPTKVVPGAKYSYQSVHENTGDKCHPNDKPLNEKVSVNAGETKKIFAELAKAKDEKFVVNSGISHVMDEMWAAKRQRSAWKNGQ